MSLLQINAFDITAFVTSVRTGLGLSGNVIFAGMQDNAIKGDCCWLQSRDRYYFGAYIDNTASPYILHVDPEFLNAASPNSLLADPVGVSSGVNFVLGQYNPVSGAQTMFAHRGAGVEQVLRTMNPDTHAIGGSAAFPTANGDFTLGQGHLGSGVEGGWVNNLHLYAWIFDGLKNGIPGETIATGTNIYPEGLLLINVDGTVDGFTFDDGFAWIDLNTRLCVGRLGGIPSPTSFPSIATGSPTGAQDGAEGPIQGDSFSWQLITYVADSDSTFANPKGEMVFASDMNPGAPGASPASGLTERIYIRFVDFNPFGLVSATGVPSRTHGRITLTSRILMQVNPMFGISGEDFATNGQTNYPPVFYDGVRRRIVAAQQNHIPTTPETVGKNAVGIWSRSPDPVIVTAPAHLAPPRTNDATQFQTFVAGDMAEPVVGQLVNWTLDRRSTEGEALTITGGIGTTSTVANGPIDDSVPSSAPGTLRVFADGIELVETTDFTVVLSTGVITWVTDQSGATLVTAIYEHRGTAAQPPHGTLLSNQSTTDTSGRALTTVVVEDDDALVGKLDMLSSDIA